MGARQRAVRAAARTRRRLAVALNGTLRDFGLADIFQLIGIQRKTGVLSLKSGDSQVNVSFLSGGVVSADSSERALEDRLGSVLVKSGKVTERQLSDALKTQKVSLQRLGKILIEQKVDLARGAARGAAHPGHADRPSPLPLEGRRVPLQPGRDDRLRPRVLHPDPRREHPDGRRADDRRMADHRAAHPHLPDDPQAEGGLPSWATTGRSPSTRPTSTSG